MAGVPQATWQAHDGAARHGLSALITLLCAAALWSVGSRPLWLAAPPAASVPIQLMLEEAAAPVEAPPPPPPPVAQPAPREAAPLSRAAATPAPAPVDVPATPAPAAPATVAPQPVAAPVVATPPPVAAAPAPKPAPPVSAGIEAEYVGRVRALLNAGKRYPTGREASMQRPQGKVRVWFTLARDGALLDSGIQDSSNSLLLDNAALATVRRAAFAAFAPEAWAGQAQHKFSAELEFVTPGS
jgi:protein TonB